MLETALKYFFDHFEPAKEPGKAAEFLSTEDIIGIIQPMVPEFKIDSFELNDLLTQNHFKKAPDRVDDKLRWLVNKR